MPTKVGIGGASGYVGVELLRLLASHPEFEPVVATGETQAGVRAADVYPSLSVAYPELVFTPLDLNAFDGAEVAFLALPHGASQDVVPRLRDIVPTIVDLGADFRLSEPSVYAQWYGEEHRAPELLAQSVFGIPELFGSELKGAGLIAAAGCYPTSAALALAPLVRAGEIETQGIVVDAASGISGAGRTLKHQYHFGTANEDFSAYALLNHRHTPEIEQAVGASGVIFTPHLAPMTRGLLATCYARPAATSPDPLGALASFYGDATFVVVGEDPPSTKATLGSNCAHITARYDARTGWVVAVCALDNLVKGAAGQMIQCANVALGLDEALGLPTVGVYP